jgi:hypothetical protein
MMKRGIWSVLYIFAGRLLQAVHECGVMYNSCALQHIRITLHSLLIRLHKLGYVATIDSELKTEKTKRWDYRGIQRNTGQGIEEHAQRITRVK